MHFQTKKKMDVGVKNSPVRDKLYEDKILKRSSTGYIT